MHKGRVVFGAMDEVVFGRPASEAIVEQLNRLGAKRAFLMVSGTLNRQTDEIENIRRGLGPRCVGTFDAMPPHTPRAAVIAAADQARAADADIIVTIGGGSITDGAKAVQLCLANDIRHPDDIDRIRAGRGVASELAAPAVRQISVPTTIAGGEFSATAGVTNEKTKVKEALRHPLLMPRAVILDPWLSLHTPEWLWLSTGIRAVDHAVETYCSIDGNAYTDSTALQALRLLGRGLPAVKRNPSDLAARLDGQIGAWISMTGIVGGTRMGASHAIGHVLGGSAGVPHGYTSCVMLPAVLAFNAEVNGDRQAEISAALGAAGQPATEVLDRFIAGLGLPRRLRDVGVKRDDLQRIATNCMLDDWTFTNPRPIHAAQEIVPILESVY